MKKDPEMTLQPEPRGPETRTTDTPQREDVLLMDSPDFDVPTKCNLRPSKGLQLALEKCHVEAQQHQSLRREAVAQTKAELDRKMKMNQSPPSQYCEISANQDDLRNMGHCVHQVEGPAHLPFTPVNQIGFIPAHGQESAFYSTAHGPHKQNWRLDLSASTTSTNWHHKHWYRHVRHQSLFDDTPTPVNWNSHVQSKVADRRAILAMGKETLQEEVLALRALIRRHVGLNDGEIEFLIEAEMAGLEP